MKLFIIIYFKTIYFYPLYLTFVFGYFLETILFVRTKLSVDRNFRRL